jgi:hypothetical protein
MPDLHGKKTQEFIFKRLYVRRKLDTADFFLILFFLSCSFDIYLGVSLPYSKLDAAIEELFGPTVIRRKIFSAGSQALTPVCAHACACAYKACVFVCIRVFESAPVAVSAAPHQIHQQLKA